MLVHSNPPKYIDMAISHPLVMIASDGIPFNVSACIPGNPIGPPLRAVLSGVRLFPPRFLSVSLARWVGRWHSQAPHPLAALAR